MTASIADSQQIESALEIFGVETTTPTSSSIDTSLRSARNGLGQIHGKKARSRRQKSAAPVIAEVQLLEQRMLLSGTPVTANIGANTEWTAVGSPYILQGNYSINTGATLTIDAGVTIQSAQGSSYTLSVGDGTTSGSLVVNPTAGSAVTFDIGSALLVSSTGTLSMANTQFDGSLTLNPGANLGSSASTSTINSVSFSSTAVVNADPNLVPYLANSTFPSNTSINILTNTTITGDVAWNLPHVTTYQILDVYNQPDVRISNGSLTVAAGVSVTNDGSSNGNFGIDVNAGGRLNLTSGIGAQTNFATYVNVAGGGTLSANTAGGVPTNFTWPVSINGGTIVSNGNNFKSTFQLGTGSTVQSLTGNNFGANSVTVDPNLVPDLANNTFPTKSTVKIITDTTVTGNVAWRLPNVATYEILDIYNSPDVRITGTLTVAAGVSVTNDGSSNGNFGIDVSPGGTLNLTSSVGAQTLFATYLNVNGGGTLSATTTGGVATVFASSVAINGGTIFSNGNNFSNTFRLGTGSTVQLLTGNSFGKALVTVDPNLVPDLANNTFPANSTLKIITDTTITGVVDWTLPNVSTYEILDIYNQPDVNIANGTLTIPAGAIVTNDGSGNGNFGIDVGLGGSLNLTSGVGAQTLFETYLNVNSGGTLSATATGNVATNFTWPVAINNGGTIDSTGNIFSNTFRLATGSNVVSLSANSFGANLVTVDPNLVPDLAGNSFPTNSTVNIITDTTITGNVHWNLQHVATYEILDIYNQPDVRITGTLTVEAGVSVTNDGSSNGNFGIDVSPGGTLNLTSGVGAQTLFATYLNVNGGGTLSATTTGGVATNFTWPVAIYGGTIASNGNNFSSTFWLGTGTTVQSLTGNSFGKTLVTTDPNLVPALTYNALPANSTVKIITDTTITGNVIWNLPNVVNYEVLDIYNQPDVRITNGSLTVTDGASLSNDGNSNGNFGFDVNSSGTLTLTSGVASQTSLANQASLETYVNVNSGGTLNLRGVVVSANVNFGQGSAGIVDQSTFKGTSPQFYAGTPVTVRRNDFSGVSKITINGTSGSSFDLSDNYWAPSSQAFVAAAKVSGSSATATGLNVDVAPYTLGGRVWLDANVNGQVNGYQDFNGTEEAGVPNVTVTIQDKTTPSLIIIGSAGDNRTVTDSNGDYSFVIPKANSTDQFVVSFPQKPESLPTGYGGYTVQNSGVDAWSDSNASPSGPNEGQTAPVQLSGAPFNFTVDAGLISAVPPKVTINPSNVTSTAGQTATFTAAASGAPPAVVQWEFSTDGGLTFNDVTGQNVRGATSDTLTLLNVTSAQSGYQYHAFFTSSDGSAVSSNATLTVQTIPMVTTNPTDQTVYAGTTATFTAAASGSPTPTVQWQVSTDGGATFNNVPNATSNTLNVTNVTAAQFGNEYQAVFTNAAGSATTTVATLKVLSAPVVTTNPISQTVNAGQAATFTAATIGFPTPAVQWQVSSNGGLTFGNIPNETSNTLTVTNLTAIQSGYEYQAVFTNSLGSATTSVATLTVISTGAIPHISVTDAGGPYTGQPFGATVSVTDANGVMINGITNIVYYVGNTVNGTGTSTIPISIGTYTVVASFVSGDPNYRSVQSQPVTFTITKAIPIVAISDAGGTYSGSPYAANATVTGIGGSPSSTLDGVPLTITYYQNGQALTTVPTQAGSYYAVAVFSGSTNYGAGYAQVAFTINKAIPMVAISDLGGTYNGNPYAASANLTGASGSPTSSLDGVPLNVTYYYNGQALASPPTQAGSYYAVATFNGSSNYGAAWAQTIFTITKAIPIVAISDAGGTYNGSPYAATATLTGASGAATSGLDGVSLAVTYYHNGQVLTSAPTLPGSYYAVAVFNGSTNYGAAYAQTSFTITKAIPKVAISDTGGPYNGNSYAATPSLIGANGVPTSSLDGVSLTVTYYHNGQVVTSVPTLPGSYYAVAAFNGSDNYGASYAFAIFTIAKATPTIFVSAPSGVHNGQPFIATAQIAGIDGQSEATLEGVGLTITYYLNGKALTSAPSAPGRYIAVALFQGSTNYNGVSARTTFTIS